MLPRANPPAESAFSKQSTAISPTGIGLSIENCLPQGQGNPHSKTDHCIGIKGLIWDNSDG